MKDFFTVILLFSDKIKQKNAWVLGKGPIFLDFDESLITFFDCEKIVLDTSHANKATNAQRIIISKFSDALHHFSKTTARDYLPEDFIDTPEWTQITEMAQEVLKAFNWDPKL
jgi:hypothetical protein